MLILSTGHYSFLMLLSLNDLQKFQKVMETPLSFVCFWGFVSTGKLFIQSDNSVSIKIGWEKNVKLCLYKLIF